MRRAQQKNDVNAIKKLAIVVVAFYLKDDALLRFIRSIARHICYSHLIIVHNGGEKLTANYLDGMHCIDGSNKLLDMSGYFEGFYYLKNELDYNGSDLVIFLNDSMPRKHPYDYIFRHAKASVEAYEKLDFFYCGIPSKITAAKSEYQYFSTYFVISNVRTVDLLIYKLLTEYKKYLKKLMVPHMKAFKTQWKPIFEHPHMNMLLKKKKRCVFFELALSHVAQENGFWVTYHYNKGVKALRFILKIRNFSMRLAAALIAKRPVQYPKILQP